MKVTSLVVLLCAAAALGWIALRAPKPDYAAPKLEEAAAHVPAPAAIAGPIPAGSVVRTFEVQGMCCGGCSGKLYRALVAVPGVSEAAVSFEEGTARAVVPETLDVAVLERALSFDKYASHYRP